MNEGFFSSTQLKSFAKPKVAPPRLVFEVPPPVEAKPKAAKVFVPKVPQMVVDVECYVNYFLINFKRLEDGTLFSYERTRSSELAIESIKRLLSEYEIITFNGDAYDIAMIKLALTGASCAALKNASDELIQQEMSISSFEKKYELGKIKGLRHIDLIEIPKGLYSLKIYGGRLHGTKLQDLPIPEDATLTEPEMDDILDYCGNDLDLTERVYTDLIPQIELRRVMSEKYKVDLKSKSDAQIAETVIVSELKAITGKDYKKPNDVPQSFRYIPPDFISFETDKLNDLFDIFTNEPFLVGSSGRPLPPKALGKNNKIRVGFSTYKVGVGGLHSNEHCKFHVANEKFSLWDWDVTSYYPEIIRKCKLFPKHLGKEFMPVYSTIVDERIAAKGVDKVKADVLKIVINGSFGKFGSPYSALYSPNLLVQVTVTGQLALLMLIEMMEGKGISVVSGNTDGIVLKCPVGREDMMRLIIKRWEKITGFNMESSKYIGLYSRDVNSYLAFKEDGEVKRKGCFAPTALDKSPENDICTEALIEYLKYGTPFEQTIKSCYDIRKFLTLRSVSGGAIKDGVYIGKSIRWYKSSSVKGGILDRKTKVQVGGTDGAMPFMDLSKPFPKDIDYDWYVSNCYDLFGKPKGE